jgi:hypothetical protein
MYRIATQHERTRCLRPLLELHLVVVLRKCSASKSASSGDAEYHSLAVKHESLQSGTKLKNQSATGPSASLHLK